MTLLQIATLFLIVARQCTFTLGQVNILDSEIDDIMSSSGLNPILPAYYDIIEQIIDLLAFVFDVSKFVEASVCYDHIGCFYKTPKSYAVRLPSPNTTKFFLTTTSDVNRMEELLFDDVDSIRKSSFNATWKTFFLIYGYRNTLNDNSLIAVKNTILQKLSCANVIFVDWNEFANVNYVEVAINAEGVGRRTAVLLYNMVILEIDILSVHVIGFSTGAQIAGFAGQYLKTAWNLTLGRITGLDPAGPMFCYQNFLAAGYHLNTSHALWVDIIHTNSGFLVFNQLSCIDCLGHVDFFPNGGMAQPYCKDKYDDPFCNHGISVTYFNSSINAEGCQFKSFPARLDGTLSKCDAPYSQFLAGMYFNCELGCSVMGFNSVDYPGGRGKQFLMTLNQDPFYGSQFLFQIAVDFVSNKISIVLTDGTTTTSPMSSGLIVGDYKFVSISTCSMFNFSKPLTTTLQFDVPGRVRKLAVVNDMDQRTCYFSSSGLIPVGLQLGTSETVVLQDTQC